MRLTDKLCLIADAGPMVHTMPWDEIGKAAGDASLRIAALEAALGDAMEHILNTGQVPESYSKLMAVLNNEPVDIHGR